MNAATPTQAAIVGIIIPIIFALVEQLFKNQDTFFKAFLHWSKVVQLTISSLSHCVVSNNTACLTITNYPLTFVFTFPLASIQHFRNNAPCAGAAVSFFFPEKRFSLILII
ncbi:MAG: hypothetical protein R3D66_03380 [Alphaproteobacteria bacterium]